jgi:hypothetical protein
MIFQGRSSKVPCGGVSLSPLGMKAYFTSPGWHMNMEHLVARELVEEAEVLGRNLPQCHFSHHKSHMTWLGIELETSRWEAGDQPPEPRHGPSSHRIFKPMSRDSAVGIATSYGLDGWGVGVRVPVGSRIFLLHVAQTGSGAHPAFYLKGTGGFFPGVKWPGREADHSPPASRGNLIHYFMEKGRNVIKFWKELLKERKVVKTYELNDSALNFNELLHSVEQTDSQHYSQ